MVVDTVEGVVLAFACGLNEFGVPPSVGVEVIAHPVVGFRKTDKIECHLGVVGHS